MRLCLLFVLIGCPVTPCDEAAMQAFHPDADGDGFGAADEEVLACTALEAGYTTDARDCDDADENVNPDGDEGLIDCDGADNDCDGKIDYGLRVPEDFAVPSEAMSVAEDDEAICVQPGTYIDNVDFETKQVRLIGVEGRDVTLLQGADPSREVILLVDPLGENQEIRGLTLSGGDSAQVGALFVNGGGVVLRDLRISDTHCVSTALYSTCGGFGARITVKPPSRIENLEVTDNSQVSDGVGCALLVQTLGDGSGEPVELAGITVAYNSSVGDNQHGAGLCVLPGAAVAASDVDIVGNIGEASEEGSISGNALYIWEGSNDVTFTRTLVADNVARGRYVFGATLVSLTDGGFFADNLVIANNSVELLGPVDYWLRPLASLTFDAMLTNCDIVGNSLRLPAEPTGEGGWIGLSGGYVDLVNCSIADNALSVAGAASAGLPMIGVGDDAPEPWIAWSSFWNNSSPPLSAEFPSPLGNSGVIEADPAYADTSAAEAADWDLTLTAGSALRDAGDPALQDADGSRSDIGSRGGPEGTWAP